MAWKENLVDLVLRLEKKKKARMLSRSSACRQPTSGMHVQGLLRGLGVHC